MGNDRNVGHVDNYSLSQAVHNDLSHHISHDTSLLKKANHHDHHRHNDNTNGNRNTTAANIINTKTNTNTNTNTNTTSNSNSTASNQPTIPFTGTHLDLGLSKRSSSNVTMGSKSELLSNPSSHILSLLNHSSLKKTESLSYTPSSYMSSLSSRATDVNPICHSSKMLEPSTKRIAWEEKEDERNRKGLQTQLESGGRIGEREGKVKKGEGFKYTTLEETMRMIRANRPYQLQS
eukprot:CAMPEP_0175049444 /NCGR_PEP_ID=MMETSP0052_2-20121109/6732_1 /TAXON_ID=51329 ORGANISM="Polytomella parva, Strain SAG 63-3" /NCGR_SAMPLE_ID=MMETSP0052_2 /ASSEMBLY_ACC=CAM_ASM_000194 /LENGTH=233 /DNA_ID=CAMNT_0016313587 /DNA_START=477 /DNA_END=1178 /DNA_ORIENTATION=-